MLTSYWRLPPNRAEDILITICVGTALVCNNFSKNGSSVVMWLAGLAMNTSARVQSPARAVHA